MATLSIPFTKLQLPTRPIFALAFVACVVAIARMLLGPGGGGWHVLAFAVMPDLALLLGIDRDLAPGQLHPRAVPLYNALHHLAGPMLLGVIAMLWLGSPWLGGALAWAAHVTADRTIGYGPRAREGFQRG